MHYLYGIWGSAFTILFRRLLLEKVRRKDSYMSALLPITCPYEPSVRLGRSVDFVGQLVCCLVFHLFSLKKREVSLPWLLDSRRTSHS